MSCIKPLLAYCPRDVSRTGGFAARCAWDMRGRFTRPVPWKVIYAFTQPLVLEVPGEPVVPALLGRRGARNGRLCRNRMVGIQ